MSPTMSYSLAQAWAAMKPRPVGILDQLVSRKIRRKWDEKKYFISASSVFAPSKIIY